MIDNFDSFTHLIVHYVEQLNQNFTICTNKTIPFSRLNEFDILFISPGPGLPEQSGKLMLALNQFISYNKPIFGICLGMQAIALHFGGKLVNHSDNKHGTESTLTVLSPDQLFKNLPNSFKIGRYHSWSVEKKLPSEIINLAESEDGQIMAIKHVKLPIWGVQYHPESIMSEFGLEIFRNFLEAIKKGEV